MVLCFILISEFQGGGDRGWKKRKDGRKKKLTAHRRKVKIHSLEIS